MKEKEEQRLLKLKEIDKEFFDLGMKFVAGIDEAGRGPLARTCCCSKCSSSC